MMKEFKEFIARGNVMDMAVGIIMGAAFTAIVTSMVGDLIMPLIGMFSNGVDFSNMFFALDGEYYPTLEAAKSADAPVIMYGSFANAVLNFLIVAFVVFLLVKGVNKIKKAAEDPKAKDAPPPSKDIVLLTEIRDALVKAPAPKAAVQKTPVKKAPVEKASAKKPVAKKAPAKKTTAKKPVAKKATTAKKTAPKKTVAKKTSTAKNKT